MLVSLRIFLGRIKRSLFKQGGRPETRLRQLAAAAASGAALARSLEPAETVPAIAPGPEGDLAQNPLWQYFDQNQSGPGIWKWPHYFPIYHRHLERFRGHSAHLLEIGIYSGGSLGMWLSYLGKSSHIHGMDIESACLCYAAPGISVHIGDQADPVFWDEFCAKVPCLDIVIDDGGHDPSQQIPTLQKLLPHLRPGGVFICEDVHGTSHEFAHFVWGLVEELNCFQPPQPTAVQAAVYSAHFYPYMIIIEKRAVPLTQLQSIKRGTQWQPFFDR